MNKVLDRCLTALLILAAFIIGAVPGHYTGVFLARLVMQIVK